LKHWATPRYPLAAEVLAENLRDLCLGSIDQIKLVIFQRKKAENFFQRWAAEAKIPPFCTDLVTNTCLGSGLLGRHHVR